MARSRATSAPQRNRVWLFFEHRLEMLEARLVLTNIGLSLFSNEPTIAVNPLNKDNVVVANFDQGRQTLGISSDGGATFNYLHATLPAGESSFDGDDSLAFDSQGRLTWTFLTSRTGGFIDVVSQQVNSITEALVGSPVFVAQGNLDKEWVAADANASSPFADNVYTVWTDFSQSGAPIRFARSTDHGATWTTLAGNISAPNEGFTWPPEVAVGPNGDVWVAWHVNTADGTGTLGGTRMRRSTDGGLTFGPELTPFPNGTADTTTNAGGTRIDHFESWLQGSLQPRILVDPARPGDVDVVSVDNPNNAYTAAGDPSDIVIARSTDNGATWTRSTIGTPNDGQIEVMPAASIDRNGDIAVTWYQDLRPSVNAGGDYLLGLFAATSTDGGATFQPAFQVTDPGNSFDPDLNAPDRFPPNQVLRIGEYNGVSLINGTAYMVWTGNEKTGAQRQETYFDTFVTHAPPVVTAPGPQTSQEGASKAFDLGSFSDPDGGPWKVDVNWGDSTPDTIFDASKPGSLGTQSHTYGEEGTKTVTVTVTDTLDNQSDSKLFQVDVADQAVVATGVPVNALAGKPLAGVAVATFTDPGGPEPNASDPTPPTPSGHYLATIDWGDSSTPSTGTISGPDANGVFTVSGSHTYATEGTFTITTTINHEGVITKVTSTATVKDNLGLLLLDPTGKDSLTVTGNGNVVVTGASAAIAVDSNNTEAAVVTGNGSVSAADIDVTGGARTTGHGSFSSPIDHEAPTPDPLGLPLPPAPSTTFAAVNYSGSAPLTLSPGTYVGGIKITGQGSVTLLPGVYYMQSGGFSVTGQGSVTDNGHGVLIVNAPINPSSDSINLTGIGNVTLSAPTSLTGAYAPYNGITIFQDPLSSVSINVTGQGGLTMTGRMYAPLATLNVDGNGGVSDTFSNGDPTRPGAIIVFDAKVTGQGGLTINLSDPPRGSAASSSSSTQPSAATTAANSAAIGSIMSNGGATGPATLTDPRLLNDVAASLGSDSLLNGKKRN